MTVRIVIPFYGVDQRRISNLGHVLTHLRACGFRTEQILIPSRVGGTMAHARNAGITYSILDHADVVVFNDADTICPVQQMTNAILAAKDAPGLVYAYDLYVRKNEDGSDGETFYNPPSMGCAAIRTDSCPRFDEEYVGWGYEDCEYAARCNELWPTRRIEGVAYHLWHGDRRDDGSPEDSIPELVERNEARWKRTLSTV